MINLNLDHKQLKASIKESLEKYKDFYVRNQLKCPEFEGKENIDNFINFGMTLHKDILIILKKKISDYLVNNHLTTIEIEQTNGTILSFNEEKNWVTDQKTQDVTMSLFTIDTPFFVLDKFYSIIKNLEDGTIRRIAV